jgi:hypothetical protein
VASGAGSKGIGGEVLAASPHLARLTALHLYRGEVGLAGARALAASPYLGQLTLLNRAGTGERS